MRGNYFEIFVFITPFLFAVIYLGITISAFFKKREHALMILLFTSIPFIFLTGFSWPTQAMPQWQLWLSQIIPSTPAINGFLALSQRGAIFNDVFYNWLHIWALIVLYLATSTFLVKKLIKKVNN
jgi:ABC-2 type transport system permease protein